MDFLLPQKAEQGQRRRDEGERISIDYAVLLMSLWTQPFSFASSNFNNKMQREKEGVLLLTVLLAVFR